VTAPARHTIRFAIEADFDAAAELCGRWMLIMAIRCRPFLIMSPRSLSPPEVHLQLSAERDQEARESPKLVSPQAIIKGRVSSAVSERGLSSSMARGSSGTDVALEFLDSSF
jgi:hypothetical protein